MNENSSDFCLNILLLVSDLLDCTYCAEQFVERGHCEWCEEKYIEYCSLNECQHCTNETYERCNQTG